MNSATGEIVEIYLDTASNMGKVRIHDDYLHVPLFLLPEARVGDIVLIEDGIAVAIVGHGSKKER